MARGWLLTVVAALAALVGACANLPPPTAAAPTPGATVEAVSHRPTLDPDSSVAQAQEAWRAAGIRDYTWVIAFACECGAPGPLQVTVVDGAVTDVRTPARELRVDDLAGFPLTVDQLLRLAADATRDGGSAKGTWRPDGVPNTLLVDPVPNAIDDELAVTVARFEPAR